MRKIKELFRCIKNWFFIKRYPFWKLTDTWYDFNTGIDDKRKGSKNFFINYNFTWYDDIPYGWKKAFGKKLSRDIKNAGMPYIKQGKKWKEILSFQQIKEKWGELCLYASAVEEIQNVLDKYETMSSGYCIACGNPARYMTRGYISFLCEDCYVKHLKSYDKYRDKPLTDEEIGKSKKEDRLTKEDITKSTSFEYKDKLIETFNSEKEARERYDWLWDNELCSGTYYKLIDNEDGTWSVVHKDVIEHVIDYKKEYGVDFYELWGL